MIPLVNQMSIFIPSWIVNIFPSLFLSNCIQIGATAREIKLESLMTLVLKVLVKLLMGDEAYIW